MAVKPHQVAIHVFLRQTGALCVLGLASLNTALFGPVTDHASTWRFTFPLCHLHEHVYRVVEKVIAPRRVEMSPKA